MLHLNRHQLFVFPNLKTNKTKYEYIVTNEEVYHFLLHHLPLITLYNNFEFKLL